MKKIPKWVLPLMLVLCLLPSAASAAGLIDPDREVGLTLSYQDAGTPLRGARFQIYRVAAVEQTGELTVTETFRDFPVDIRGENETAWKALASTLQGYVLRDNVTPTDSGETDASGRLAFPTNGTALEQGLYLVLGERHSQGRYYYDAAPFLVLLPSQDAEKNEWVYDATAEAKSERTKIPSDSPDSPGSASVKRKVLKVWDDAGHEDERPQEVAVQLLRDGAVYDTVTLSAANNWRYTWSDLDETAVWTVVEEKTEHYSVSVTREGITFVVTNTYAEDIPDTPTPGDPGPTGEEDTPSSGGEGDQPSGTVTPSGKLPQTGQLWWPVPLLLLCGLAFIALGLLMRRRSDEQA